MYHAIGSAANGDRQGRYSVAPRVFVEQMRWLVLNYREQLVPLYLCAESAKGIAITFDDGYADNLYNAAPVLAELSIPFTVFVTTGYARSGDRRYLSPEALRELARMPGATIGAHGRTHCRLTDCDDSVLNRELGDSRAWLEDVLGQAVTSMSYPHGALNDRVQRAVCAHGYEIAASSRFGCNHEPYKLLALKRTDIWRDDESHFHQKISGAWDWLGWR